MASKLVAMVSNLIAQRNLIAMAWKPLSGLVDQLTLGKHAWLAASLHCRSEPSMNFQLHGGTPQG